MIIDETTKKIIENPDYSVGEVYDGEVDVIYKYILEKPAEYEEKVVAEYPNGGKDVEIVEVSPEVGNWVLTNLDGEEYPIPNNTDFRSFVKGDLNYLKISVSIYHRYTPEELKEVEEENRRLEEQQREAKEKQETMDALPGRVDTVETTQDDMVLLLADIIGGAM